MFVSFDVFYWIFHFYYMKVINKNSLIHSFTSSCTGAINSRWCVLDRIDVLEMFTRLKQPLQRVESSAFNNNTVATWNDSNCPQWPRQDPLHSNQSVFREIFASIWVLQDSEIIRSSASSEDGETAQQQQNSIMLSLAVLPFPAFLPSRASGRWRADTDPRLDTMVFSQPRFPAGEAHLSGPPVLLSAFNQRAATCEAASAS